MRTKTLTALGVLGLLGGGLFSLERPAPRRSSHAARAGAAAEAPRGSCALEVGDQLSYALTIDAHALVHGDRLGAQGDTAVTRKVEATLALETLSTGTEAFAAATSAASRSVIVVSMVLLLVSCRCLLV